jgi:hypothetical protein
MEMRLKVTARTKNQRTPEGKLKEANAKAIKNAIPFQPQPDSYIDVSSTTGEITRWVKIMTAWFKQVGGGHQDTDLILIMMKGFMKPKLRMKLEQYMLGKGIKDYNTALGASRRCVPASAVISHLQIL